MRFIGVLGVLVLLGLAWAMSYHKRDVRPRVVLWGLGLQFLFALIILRNDFWSFVGMGTLGALVVVYMLRRDPVAPDRGYRSVAALLVGASAVSAGLGFLDPPVAGIGVLILLTALLVNNRFKLVPALQAPLA
ncbi:MAG: Na+ dependent nucleoside transporter N-terminal domain-containing protein, partial [Acidobacteriota bacterium]